VTTVRPAVPRLALTETPLTVRFADVDMMQLAHHSVYIHWFEQVRFHFLERVARVPFGTFLEAGIAFPVVSCAAEYLRPVRFGDAPVGYARMVFSRRALVTLHYEILSARGGRVCARGQTEHCYVDRGFKLLVSPPPLLHEVFGRAARECPEAFLFADDMRVPAEPAVAHAGAGPV
jgi:acyl-CoA thioester hydrolase